MTNVFSFVYWAVRPEAVVFAIVRGPKGSTHLNALAASLKNIHIIPGDVVDYSTLEVGNHTADLGLSNSS